MESLRALADAGRREARTAYDRHRSVFESAEKSFPGLGEPLSALDFTEHRWVAGHREEAYSDWLAWIVKGLEAEEVLRVFGVDDQQMRRACMAAERTEVSRERFVPRGHDGASGRLDLVVEFENRAALVVEVKVTGADDADTDKHRGYLSSIEEAFRDKGPVSAVLVANDGDSDDYEGFALRGWEDVCLELRLIAADLNRNEQRLRAAMILGFVSAVEQKLLGFWAEDEDCGMRGLRLGRTARYLSRFLERQ